MAQLNVNEKDIVIPGTLLAEGLEYLAGTGTYRQEDKLFSKFTGIVSLHDKLVKIIPLSGKYDPKKSDLVIGIVNEVRFSNWDVDINSPYSAVLPASEALNNSRSREHDLSRIYVRGDAIVTKIINVTRKGVAALTMKEFGLKKLREGTVVTISPTKVPRVIGKRGSMVSLIKNYTQCRIIVGQNGRIWIAGSKEGEDLAVEIIKKIEDEAHTVGLTDRIKAYLEAKKNE